MARPRGRGHGQRHEQRHGRKQRHGQSQSPGRKRPGPTLGLETGSKPRALSNRVRRQARCSPARARRWRERSRERESAVLSRRVRNSRVEPPRGVTVSGTCSDGMKPAEPAQRTETKGRSAAEFWRSAGEPSATRSVGVLMPIEGRTNSGEFRRVRANSREFAGIQEGIFHADDHCRGRGRARPA